MPLNMEFYRGRKVLVTGHTGFKGTWLCRMLVNAGAAVTGYALEPPTDPALFDLAGLEGRMESVTGDIRDLEHLQKTFEAAQPEIVFHLAAQPIVRESYKDPRLTYETNVMGTVNLLECVRQAPSVKSVLNVTTDKVYLNRDEHRAFREDDPLDGFDPYSNSKSCSELVTHSYISSFFAGPDAPAVSTARAGNVIGGGDFAADRIIPDCVRAVRDGKVIGVRNPDSVRPFQHVLEPLAVYLEIAQRQYGDKAYAGYYNVGPDDCDCVTTGELVDLFCSCWGEGAAWENRSEANAPHESGFLKLDCARLRQTFGWKPTWNIRKAIEMTVAWTKTWRAGDSIPETMDRQIAEFIAAL